MCKINIISGNIFTELQNLEDESFDLIIVDPPNNIKNIKKLKENLQVEEYIDYSRLWLKECKRVLKEDGTIYIFLDIKHIVHINDILLREFDMNFINWISWKLIFNNSISKLLPYSHNDILMFSKSSVCNVFRDNTKISMKYYQKENNMRELGFGDIWRFSLNSKSTLNNSLKQKPEALIARLISDSSKIGDSVLNLFSGSGTTLRVCQQLNRNCIGIVVNLKYVTIINKRLQKEFTSFDSI
jgi:site-specific DNA-methyltransferase (adenine-specific)